MIWPCPRILKIKKSCNLNYPEICKKISYFVIFLARNDIFEENQRPRTIKKWDFFMDFRIVYAITFFLNEIEVAVCFVRFAVGFSMKLNQKNCCLLLSKNVIFWHPTTPPTNFENCEWVKFVYSDALNQNLSIRTETQSKKCFVN